MASFMQKARRTLIGDRAFYRAVLAIIIPVIIQNGISNFVNILDNLMVGALGDAQMSGVSIANQLVFVFNLAVFGGLAGPGIFGAQFSARATSRACGPPSASRSGSASCSPPWPSPPFWVSPSP